MHCYRARKLLNESEPQSEELKRHLDICPDCAQIALADAILTESFAHERRSRQPSVVPFAELRESLKPRLAAVKPKEHGFMEKAKIRAMNHKRLSFAAAAFAVVLLIATLVPFPYSQLIGHSVILEGLDADSQDGPAKLTELLERLGYSSTNITTETGNVKSRIVIGPLPSRKAALELITAYSLSVGDIGQAAIRPIMNRVSGTLFAQAKNRLLEIRVEAAGKSDSEIEAEIEAKLRQQGFANAGVNVSTDQAGLRNIDIDIADSTDSTAEKRQIKVILPSDSTIAIETEDAGPDEIGIVTEGKTDREVEAEIRQRLAERGITDARIVVNTDSTGRREIRVEIKKER